MHSRQQSRLDPSPFIVRTVIGFRHSIAGQPPKQAASCSVRSAIVVFPEIASFILILHENAARLLLRPQQLRQLGVVMPTEMEIRASLPRTPVGKLSKKELMAEEIAKRQASDGLPANAPEVA
jgi:hypothetical protein